MTLSLQRRLRARASVGLRILALPALLLAGCATSQLPGAAPPAPPVSPPPGLSSSAASAPVVESPPVPAAAASAAKVEAQAAIAAPIVVDPLRPEVHLDFDDRAARIDLWGRVRKGFAVPDLDSDLVHDWERWYATRPDYVQRMTERGSRYLFHIIEELDRRGMPTELALLPFIESAYNPQAMSTAKASGMWQFIPSTGRDFLLKQNVFRDDRRDVLASTRAALDYLQKLHGMFGDWHLALAAYNWGEGNVQRAIARSQKAGLPTDYENLKMPSETQLYVPKLQAVKNIIARPADFGLTLPVVTNHPYFLAVPIERDLDVALAVKLAGMSLEEFQTLNPQMNKPVILAAGTPQILLPYDNANHFVRRLPQQRGPLATWTAWIAPRTMRTAEAAKEIGIAEEQLRDINKIPARMLVRAGSTLLVPRGEGRLADVSLHVADNAVMALAPDVPPLRKVALKAGRKDTVASVARRYRVSPAQIAQWNEVAAAAAFRPGQTILVYVAAKVPVARASHGTTNAKNAARTKGGTRTASAPALVHATRAARGKPAKKSLHVAHN